MRTLIAFLILLSCCPHSAAQKNKLTVRILFPMFESRTAVEAEPGTIGNRTSTILGLQVWRTLRVPPGRPGGTIRKGGIFWDFEATPKTYEEAEEVARNQQPFDVQLVLWGKAAQYGDGIVVESNLSILNDGTGGQLGTDIWTAAISHRGRRRSISVNIPGWRYEFAPIVLESSILPELNDASQIKLYAQPDRKTVIGDLSEFNFSARRHVGEYTQVWSSGQVGWIYLPNISKNSEVINFCGGVIRIFRKDWDGALSLLREVVNNVHAPTTVKVDAYLYMAVAAEKLGNRALSLSFIEQAYSLNPFLKITTQYLLMSHLANLSQFFPHQIRSSEAQRSIEAVRSMLTKNRVLFAERDDWLMQVEQFLADVTSR